MNRVHREAWTRQSGRHGSRSVNQIGTRYSIPNAKPKGKYRSSRKMAVVSTPNQTRRITLPGLDVGGMLCRVSSIITLAVITHSSCQDVALRSRVAPMRHRAYSSDDRFVMDTDTDVNIARHWRVL